jgi:fucose permease
VKIEQDRIKSVQRALMVIFFAQGVAALSWMPRIPEFIENLGVSKEVWGTLIGLGGIGAIIPLIFTNRLVQRFGTSPIIRTTSIAMIGLFMALPYPTQWWLFLVLHFSLSFVLSVFNIALNSQAVVFQTSIKKVLLASFHGAWSIGAASSAAITSLVAVFTPLKIQMLVIPLFVLVLFIWAGKQLLTEKEDSHFKEKPKEKAPSWRKSPAYLWLLSVGLFAGMWPELVVMDWSSVYSREVLDLDPARAAWPYTVFVAAMIIGRFSITRLTVKYSINRLSQIGGLFGTLAMALAIFTSSTLAQTNQSLALFSLCFFFAIAGIGIASMVPSFYSAAGHISKMPTPAALSRMALFSSVVVIFARMLMGSLTERFGLPLAMIFPIVMFFAAALISAAVANRNKRLEQEQAIAYPPTSPVATIDVAN